jgi:hypothetical protein
MALAYLRACELANAFATATFPPRMPKRRDGRPMCLARHCRRARRDGAMLCSEHFADQLWSEAIKARDGGCIIANEKCFGRLEADHLIPRSYAATRWLLEIGATLCLAHHKYVTEHPLEHEELAVQIIGEKRYADLRQLALTYEREDPEAVIARLS